MGLFLVRRAVSEHQLAICPTILLCWLTKASQNKARESSAQNQSNKCSNQDTNIMVPAQAQKMISMNTGSVCTQQLTEKMIMWSLMKLSKDILDLLMGWFLGTISGKIIQWRILLMGHWMGMGMELALFIRGKDCLFMKLFGSLWLLWLRKIRRLCDLSYMNEKLIEFH